MGKKEMEKELWGLGVRIGRRGKREAVVALDTILLTEPS